MSISSRKKQLLWNVSVHLHRTGKRGQSVTLSRGAVSFTIFLFGVLFIGFVSSAVLFLYANAQLEQVDIQLSKTTEDVEEMHADMARIVGVAHELESVIDSAVIDSPSDSSVSLLALPIRFDRAVSDDTSRLGSEPEYVENILKSAQLSFQNINDLLDSQNGFLSDIPSIWPLRNNHGRVTLEFGPNRHPKTNQWYLHKGIDIAGAYGVEVLASASGKVIEAGYGRSGYGNYVLIRHKYGFRTRYSHLSSIRVEEGQDIVQGGIIGTLGSTGISTGPHLDFQIILGTDVIDPAQFLKISRQQFERWAGNRY